MNSSFSRPTLQFAATNSEAVGQATFKHWSPMLWNQVCGENTELQKLAKETELSVDKLKALFSAVLTGLGMGPHGAAIVAVVAVGLFFNVVAPAICKKWTQWNESAAPDFYQANLALPTASLQELSKDIPNSIGGN